MAKHQTASQRKKTIFCFTVACYKFTGEAPQDCKPQQGRPDATIRRWLCWSRRRKLIKTSAAKTVPLDGSPSAASTTNTLVRSKIKKFPLIGSKGRGLEAERHRSTAEEDSESGDRRVQETKAAHHNVATTVDPTESEIANTCPPRNLLTDGNLVADRAATGGGVQTGSSYQLRLTPTVRSAVMSPSSSSPPHPTTPKPLLKTAAGKKLEPVVGMSVIMVTLVVMIMWGRLYAILCTSACLYFIPKFRPREGSGGLRRLNLDSHGGLGRREAEEYKKKVVLEGLLERNRRR